MAINKLTIIDLLIDNVPGSPPPEDTLNKDSIYTQQPDLTCTPNSTMTKAQRQVVGMDNVGGKGYCKATGLYNKHQKFSEQWNPWHPCWSVHNFPQIQLLNQQTKTWIDRHVRHGLHNCKIKTFQSADALRCSSLNLISG
jgi:hypothetical protein